MAASADTTRGMGADASGAALLRGLRTGQSVTRENYLNFYQQKEALLADPLFTSIQDQEAIETYWRNFYRKSWAAWLLAGAYGGLQGWGMAGFVLSMTETAELDPWVSHLISLGVALPVALMNGWLVRPDWENYIVFEEYKKLFGIAGSDAKKISFTAKFCCGVSSILLGVVTAYGITGCLEDNNAYLHTNDQNMITFAMVMMTTILALSECLLNIKSFDEVLDKGLRKHEQALYDEYKNSTSQVLGYDVKKRTQAAIVYNTSFILSVLGMIGIALVGTVPFSHMLAKMFNIENEDTAMGIAAGILILAAFTQIPFYRDRALHITKRCVEIPNQPPPDQPNLVFTSMGGKTCGTILWGLNALCNSPCAFIGVVSTLGHFANLEKPEETTGSIFEKIFCPFGTSDNAMDIYYVGAAFFMFAFSISLAANYPPVTKMADPKAETAKLSPR